MVNKHYITAATLCDGAAKLRAGGLVAFPTETVYGLGADACNTAAVHRLFAAKGRPSFNPLIAHLATAEGVFEIAQETPSSRLLAQHFWPGPLTIVLAQQAHSQISTVATAGLDSCAFRVPANSDAKALLTAFNGPVVAPSANPSGQVSPTTAGHVADGLGNKIDLILDGGRCQIGLESTVIDARGAVPRILRPGAITASMLAAVLGCDTGEITSAKSDDAVTAPGMLASHYAPHHPVRLNAAQPRPGEAFLGFGELPTQDGLCLTLSASSDLLEAAANLFAMLRDLDRMAIDGIAVAPIADDGIGAAINDRLRRAAAPRNDPAAAACRDRV